MRKLGMGLMRLPLLNPNDQKSINYEEATKMVDRYMERGFTYFDTAFMYHAGESEVFVRKAIVERYPRESFTITDKLPAAEITTYEDMQRVFDIQLERTGAGYFDYYWFHAINKNYVELLDRINGWDFLKKLKEDGKAKHIGFSFHDDSETLESVLANHPEFEYVQLQINYIDWDSPVEGKKCYEICEKYGKPVVVMEPVKGGSPANVPEEVETMMKEVNPDMSPASWAVRYCASLPNVLTVLSGMSNMAQLEDNIGYMEDFKPLDAQEIDLIHRVVDTITKNIDIPCTACHYCTGKCPQNIAIPQYFGLMNVVKELGESQVPNSRLYYNLLAKNHGKASDCIGCGQCEGMCPQHLPIIDNLVRVAERFEQK
ncbi:MAG: aldo/keto reductase [Muribaculaceae bacterium]|nr:aldo/keto reductase [Muribaculaceae bacterium]